MIKALCLWLYDRFWGGAAEGAEKVDSLSDQVVKLLPVPLTCVSSCGIPPFPCPARTGVACKLRNYMVISN